MPRVKEQGRIARNPPWLLVREWLRASAASPTEAKPRQGGHLQAMWVFAMCSVSARRLESRVIEMESVRGAKPYGSTAGLDFPVGGAPPTQKPSERPTASMRE